MRTDEQTDMTKLIVAVRNVANAPKNGFERSRRTVEQESVGVPCNRLSFFMSDLPRAGYFKTSRGCLRGPLTSCRFPRKRVRYLQKVRQFINLFAFVVF